MKLFLACLVFLSAAFSASAKETLIPPMPETDAERSLVFVTTGFCGGLYNNKDLASTLGGGQASNVDGPYFGLGLGGRLGFGFLVYGRVECLLEVNGGPWRSAEAQGSQGATSVDQTLDMEEFSLTFALGYRWWLPASQVLGLRLRGGTGAVYAHTVETVTLNGQQNTGAYDLEGVGYLGGAEAFYQYPLAYHLMLELAAGYRAGYYSGLTAYNSTGAFNPPNRDLSKNFDGSPISFNNAGFESTLSLRWYFHQ